MPQARVTADCPAAPLAWLREARWLHGGRMRAYARLWLLGTVLVALARIVLSRLGVGPLGFPIHADYVSFWAAGRLALAGAPQAAYDVVRHWAVQRAQFPDAGYSAFFYPPVFLLLCAPAALVGFYPSFVGFLGLSLLGYWRALRRMLPGEGVVFLGFPAVAANLIFGQNGFLTTALFATALTALPRRPALAGVWFGCLCYKPHLGLTVPLALLAAGAWRTFAAAAVTVAALAGASVVAFGLGTWRAFLAAAPLARHTLEHGLVDNAS
jgi:alpha-1,2-mannosyltransferase